MCDRFAHLLKMAEGLGQQTAVGKDLVYFILGGRERRGVGRGADE
jgi:hypothetical protein